MMLGSAKSEHLRVNEHEIIFEEYQPMSSQSINVTDRQTDGRTDGMRSQDCTLHYSASRCKNVPEKNKKRLN